MNAGTKTAPKVGPVYLVWGGEMMLNAPVKEAWPHVLNYPAWQNFSTVQHVSGARGQEGELVILKKEEEGAESYPPYFARTVKLDPPHRIMWKTYPEKRPKEGEFDFFGFVEFKLFEASDKTRFCYSSLYEFQVPYSHESELETFRKQQYENVETMFSAILPKLKKLVEKGA